jgi:hypothetical protein
MPERLDHQRDPVAEMAEVDPPQSLAAEPHSPGLLCMMPPSAKMLVAVM